MLSQGYISIYFVQIEKHLNREEFEGGLHEKRKGKGGKEEKKKRVIKHTFKHLYELKCPQKIHINSEEF